nr:trigger factor [Tanacetum cinerariifolium]
MADYVKNNNIPVKENKVNTIQSIEELQSSFTPGNDFGFNATLELEKVDTETTSTDSSEAEKVDTETTSTDSSEAEKV